MKSTRFSSNVKDRQLDTFCSSKAENRPSELRKQDFRAGLGLGEAAVKPLINRSRGIVAFGQPMAVLSGRPSPIANLSRSG